MSMRHGRTSLCLGHGVELAGFTFGHYCMTNATPSCEGMVGSLVASTFSHFCMTDTPSCEGTGGSLVASIFGHLCMTDMPSCKGVGGSSTCTGTCASVCSGSLPVTTDCATGFCHTLETTSLFEDVAGSVVTCSLTGGVSNKQSSPVHL